jgi:hypothetical protein
VGQISEPVKKMTNNGRKKAETHGKDRGEKVVSE